MFTLRITLHQTSRGIFLTFHPYQTPGPGGLLPHQAHYIVQHRYQSANTYLQGLKDHFQILDTAQVRYIFCNLGYVHRARQLSPVEAGIRMTKPVDWRATLEKTEAMAKHRMLPLLDVTDCVIYTDWTEASSFYLKRDNTSDTI